MSPADADTPPPTPPPADASADRATYSLAPAKRDRLVRLAARFVRDPNDAEDAVQAAWLLADARRHQVRDPNAEWSWLCRIVVHQCYLIRRKAGARRETALADATPPIDRNRGPASRAAQREFDAIIASLIAELPERQQTALVLRHLEGMGYAAIAAVMEIGESTVRVHVRAAREALRDLMNRRHPDWRSDA